jgi:S1-C subfamily serine protease
MADSSLPALRIEFVKPGEPAARVGFAMGDGIDLVDGRRFSTVVALHDWLKTKKATDRISVLVRRGAALDPRQTGEFHRFDMAVGDVRLITAGE